MLLFFPKLVGGIRVTGRLVRNQMHVTVYHQRLVTVPNHTGPGLGRDCSFELFFFFEHHREKSRNCLCIVSNPGQTLVMLAPCWRAASFVVLWLFVETCAMPMNPVDHGS